MSTLAEDPTAFERLQEAVAGTWSIERELGRGGMGTVYLARDVALDRPVALKVLHPALAADPEQRERFIREARTGARLSHPHIVPIYAVEAHDDLVYFVMGLVDGESVGDRLRREGPLDARDAERILREVAWALSYAHAMGIVHRDVTIENILQERQTGRAVLADFGIASSIDRDGEEPLIGSPSYLAPEVIQGQAASPASDLYALGVAGWTMLAGRTPFTADDTPALLLKHLTEPVPPLLRAAPATPSRMRRAIEVALAKDPAGRPDGAEAWLTLLAGEGESVGLAEPLRRWMRRWEMARPFYALGMSVTAMLSVGSLATFRTRLGEMPELGFILAAILPVAAAVGIVHLGIEMAALRRLARHGFRHGDLVQAVKRARLEAIRTGPRQPTLLGRVVNDLAWIGLFAYLLLEAFGSLFLPNIGRADWALWLARREFFASIMQYAYVAFWCGLGFNVLVPSSHFKPDGWWARLRDGFWSSTLGSRMLQLASIGLGRTEGTEHTLHRPTELVLDLAIEELWRALPPRTRQDTADLPRIVRELGNRIGEARELRASLLPSLGLGSGEADALDARLAAREERSLIALERLRLALARISSVAAASGELTTKLRDARALEQELLVELGAHTEVKRLLRRALTPTTLTPRETPA